MSGLNIKPESISALAGKTALVVGDIMLDRYTFGEITRVSPESAAAPVVKKIKEKFVLGGAANVASNIVGLGAQVYLCGVIGQDQYKEIVISLLNERGINSDSILLSQEKPTTVKQRLIVNNRQIARIDDESTAPLDKEEDRKLLVYIIKALEKSDVIIFSDYAKGVISKNLASNIINLAKKKNKKIIGDIKPINKSLFRDIDVITPNIKEAEELSGEKDLSKIGPKLVSDFNADVIITRGADGASLFCKNGDIHHLPAHGAQAFDVTGAGDTFVATLSLALATGQSLPQSTFLANCASSIVVRKIGTDIVSLAEIKKELL
ncbi:MAG: PfkB family carbohydrate kinase [bacterium]|nr:PfkB family carbohydrate kinase [bacterium]